MSGWMRDCGRRMDGSCGTRPKSDCDACLAAEWIGRSADRSAEGNADQVHRWHAECVEWDMGCERVPDATTLLKFRRRLERHKLD